MMDQLKTWLQQNLLLVLTIISVFVGIASGGFIRYLKPDSELVYIIGFPGEIFMNMLKALILPTIMCSLISGLSQMNVRVFGKLGSRAVLYYASTTVLATVVGIVLVTVISPGNPKIKAITRKEETVVPNKVANLDTFLDIIRNLITDNLVRSTFQSQQTISMPTNASDERAVQRKQVFNDGTNYIGLITFCIVMGIVISLTGSSARPLAEFFKALDLVVTKILDLVMWFGVIGIPSLIAKKMLDVEDITRTVQTLGTFMLTAIAGLAIHCFLTLPVIFFLATRRNPYRFLRGLAQAAITAFGTSSSSATLSVTFRCLDGLGVDERVSKFMLPVGTTVNMDGTALYEATASIFIAQINGMQLSIGNLLTVSITAILSSIGAAAIPSAGVTTMVIILTALRLPIEDSTFIIAIDWLLDRVRTVVNVIGDAYGCGIVYHLSKDDLDKLSRKTSTTDNETHCTISHENGSLS